MENAQILKARKIVKEIRNSRKDTITNYHQMTAPCGLPCFECYMYLANESPELQRIISRVTGIPVEFAVCNGCRNKDGKPDHIPMACNLYPCAEKRGVRFCSDCSDFPCDHLHPYADNAMLPHNTKVFSLCLIKKMGLESWAKNKAGSVLDVYFYEKWSL